MNDKPATLLIVEDDVDIAEMLVINFKDLPYRVLVANFGEDGVQLAQAERPDLVILDIRLPDIDGFEVARRLRGNRRTRDIPIIFLTERRERKDRLQGLQLQADDYINKPFDTQELRLRVRNTLNRSHQANLNSPVTGLPQGALVDEALVDLSNQSDQRLLTISLVNLDAFRESYGIVAQDDLLRTTSLMLRDILGEQAVTNAFLGHLTPTSWMIISNQTGKFPLLRQIITRRLESTFLYFYSERDRTQMGSNPQRLSVVVQEFNPADFKRGEPAQLRAELERLVHQVNL